MSVRRLATGSIPATLITLTCLSFMDVRSEAARSLITLVLCGALLMTAGVLIFRTTIVAFYSRRSPGLDNRKVATVTVIVGAFLGTLVSISSVGAGAVGVVVLTILYPRLPMVRIVGSDIAHAVPLTLIAGAGHWMVGAVDWHIIGSLLAGSLPGIILGSCIAFRISEAAMRLVMAVTLIVVASKLAYDHVENGPELLTAFTRRAPLN